MDARRVRQLRLNRLVSVNVKPLTLQDIGELVFAAVIRENDEDVVRCLIAAYAAEVEAQYASDDIAVGSVPFVKFVEAESIARDAASTGMLAVLPDYGTDSAEETAYSWPGNLPDDLEAYPRGLIEEIFFALGHQCGIESKEFFAYMARTDVASTLDRGLSIIENSILVPSKSGG